MLGVDIGGTNLVVATIPRSGGPPVSMRTRATRQERGPDAAIADVAAMADRVISETLGRAGGSRSDVLGVGIGCPGPLDLDTGSVLHAPNLDWSGFPVRDRVAEAVGLDATLDNDANCATYGEWWAGAGVGATSLVCVTLGTGIGGGFIEDGRLFRGATGSALEIGHMTIDVDGRICGCGNRGCLEAYASGPAIAARATEGIGSGSESVLSALVDGDLNAMTAETVSDAALGGDGFAAGIMSETAQALGVGLANVVNVLNPERIVIVGGVTAAGAHLFVPLEAEVRRRAFERAVEGCSIVPGALPHTAGVIGAAGVFLAERGL